MSLLCVSLAAAPSYSSAVPPRAGSALHAATAGRSPAAVAVAGRRALLDVVVVSAAGSILAGLPLAASASGGATAGKYTTIPVAKRRYFGRVKQGVFEFLNMGGAVEKGDFKSQPVTAFFSQTIVSTSARQKSGCAMSDNCKVKEEYTSRWEDMQFSMFLLGNAFRLDSGKPPEKVKQVKEAKAFFSEVEKLQRAMRQNNAAEAKARFASATNALDVYLNDVDLPPTVDDVYSSKADTKVPSLCQGSFCV